MKSYSNNDNKAKAKMVKKIAGDLGFDFCGIAPVKELTKEKHHYEKWLSKKCQGKMGYLEKNIPLRFNPTLLVENTKSIISLAVNYFPREKQNKDAYYKISKYAYGKDYHFILKEMMSNLLTRLKDKIAGINGRGFVDSAPVMEKAWAQKAGLGWMGKNGNLIIPKHGSYYFLCELMVDIELEYDVPFEKNYCGNCTECINNCPTGAIKKNGFVDAQKCISYLTIELKDNIDKSAGYPKYNNWIFGCDVCQDVCPWNRFSKPANKNLFVLNHDIINLKDQEWDNLTKEKYTSLIKKTFSPISRIKFEKLKSNIEHVRTSRLL